MAEGSKVMDVAKPGSSKPETGAKPMVVGHKIMKDPTLKDTVEETTEEPQQVKQSGGKTISPINHDEEAGETKNAGSAQKDDSSTEENPQVAESKTEEQPVNNPSKEAEAEPVESTQEQQDKAVLDQRVEQEENLQKIIKEKTYYVHIEEASLSALKTFIKTFLIVGVVGVIVLVVLIDAGIIDLGITLPFDFL